MWNQYSERTCTAPSLKAAATAATTTFSLRRGIVLLLLPLLLCEAAAVAHGFAFAPVIASFATAETSANKLQSRLACQQGGGYIAGEPTAALHESVIQTVRSAGAGDTWYAFLGADTEASPAQNCPQPITAGSDAGGASYGCYWRWNQGRWVEMADNTALPLYNHSTGVTFYIGNTYKTPVSTAVKFYGATGGFPIFFDYAATEAGNRRPGMLFGKELLVVGKSDTSTWSDNLGAGGYSYAGYSFSSIVGVSVWNSTAQASTKPYFWAICQTQAPSRTMYELANTSSGLQENWWVIYFVVLFVVMFVIFLVAAVCQDDEDMDEPPEDAPVWAQQEMQSAKRTKSFVSTRSFHGNAHNNEDDNDDGANRVVRRGQNNTNGEARRGSTSSDASSRRSNRRGSEGDYQGYEAQQQQRQALSTAGSHHHLGRQNGSTYNMQQAGPTQYAHTNYVDVNMGTMPQNNWM
jgi:hypothetical protein